MARRSDHSRDELKEMILNTAATLLADGGIYAISARNIAGQIGYTVGTLYNVFKNLDDIILHVNAATLQELQAKLAGTTNAAEMAAQYHQFALENRNRWRAIFEHHMQSGDAVPAWYLEQVQAMFHAVETELQPGLSNREVKTLWAAVHGICMLAVNGTLEVTGDDATALLADVTARYA